MVVDPGPAPLFGGPDHRWEVPEAGRPVAFFAFLLALFVLGVELSLIGFDLLYFGYVRGQTARGCAAVGLVLLVAGNLKSVALALRRDANESLTGMIDLVLKRLWTLHFWFNPLGLISLGLFLLFAPRPQPPFYYVAYGVLLWQAASGLLTRRAVPLRGATGAVARAARATHSQPAIYVLLAVLAAGGFVDSLFP